MLDVDLPLLRSSGAAIAETGKIDTSETIKVRRWILDDTFLDEWSDLQSSVSASSQSSTASQACAHPKLLFAFPLNKEALKFLLNVEEAFDNVGLRYERRDLSKVVFDLGDRDGRLLGDH